MDEVLGGGQVDVHRAIGGIGGQANAGARVVAGEGVTGHHDGLDSHRDVGRGRAGAGRFAVNRRGRQAGRRRVDDHAPEAGRAGSGGRRRDGVFLVRAGGVQHPDAHLVLADGVAIGVDGARVPDQHGGRSRRCRGIGVAADRVAIDLGRGPAADLDTVLGDVGNGAVAADGVAGDVGARPRVVDEDARLLVGRDDVVGDVGRAGGAPGHAADDDGVAVLAAAVAGVAHVDDLVVVDVGVGRVADGDAVADAAAARRAGAADGEAGHLHAHARAGDLDDTGVGVAGDGDGGRGLDDGHVAAVFAGQGQVFVDGDLLDVGAFVDQHRVAGGGVVDFLLNGRPDAADVVEHVGTARVAIFTQVGQQVRAEDGGVVVGVVVPVRRPVELRVVVVAAGANPLHRAVAGVGEVVAGDDGTTDRLHEPLHAGAGAVEADRRPGLPGRHLELVAGDLAAVHRAGEARAAGQVNADTTGKDVVVNGVALDVGRIARHIELPVVEVDRAGRVIDEAVLQSEGVADDLDRLVLAGAVGADLQAGDGHAVTFDEDAGRAEVGCGVGIDAGFRGRRVGDVGVGGVHALDGDAVLGDEQAEDVRAVGAQHEAVRGRLAVVAGQHAHRAADIHGVDGLLDGLEGVGRSGAAVGHVAAVVGVGVAGVGAQLPDVDEGARPRFAAAQRDGRGVGRRVAVGARGALQRPGRGRADFGHGVVAGDQRGRGGALAVAQGEVRAPTGVELEVGRVAGRVGLLDHRDRPRQGACAVEVAAEEPGGVVVGAEEVRRLSGAAPPVARHVERLRARNGQAVVAVAGVARAGDGVAVDVDVVQIGRHVIDDDREVVARGQGVVVDVDVARRPRGEDLDHVAHVGHQVVVGDGNVVSRPRGNGEAGVGAGVAHRVAGYRDVGRVVDVERANTVATGRRGDGHVVLEGHVVGVPQVEQLVAAVAGRGGRADATGVGPVGVLHAVIVHRAALHQRRAKEVDHHAVGLVEEVVDDLHTRRVAAKVDACADDWRLDVGLGHGRVGELEAVDGHVGGPHQEGAAAAGDGHFRLGHARRVGQQRVAGVVGADAGVGALERQRLVDDDVLGVDTGVDLDGVAVDRVAVVDGGLDGAELLSRIDVLGHDPAAGAHLAGVGAVAGEGVAGDQGAADGRVAAAEELVGQVGLVAVDVGVGRVGQMAALYLRADLVVGQRVARHGHVQTLDNDAEAFAGAGLLVAADGVVADDDAGGDVDVVVAGHPAAANDADAGPVTPRRVGQRRAHGHIVVLDDDAAVAGGQACAVGQLDLDAEAAVVGQGVVGDEIRPRAAGQAGEGHAAVGVAADRVARHRHAAGRAVLQLDAAAVVAGHGVVGDGDVGLEAVPDDDAAGAVARGRHIVDQDVIDRAIHVDAAAGVAGDAVVIDGHILDSEVVILAVGPNAGAGVGGEVLDAQVLNGDLGDAAVDVDAIAGERRTVDDRAVGVVSLARAANGHRHANGDVLRVDAGHDFQQVAGQSLADAILLDGAVDAGDVVERTGVPKTRLAGGAVGRALEEEAAFVEGVVGDDATPVGVGVAQHGRGADRVSAPGHHVAALDQREVIAGDRGRADRVEPPGGRTGAGEGQHVVEIDESVVADGARADVVGPARAVGDLEGHAGLVGAGEVAVGDGVVGDGRGVGGGVVGFVADVDAGRAGAHVEGHAVEGDVVTDDFDRLGRLDRAVLGEELDALNGHAVGLDEHRADAKGRHGALGHDRRLRAGGGGDVHVAVGNALDGNVGLVDEGVEVIGPRAAGGRVNAVLLVLVIGSGQDADFAAGLHGVDGLLDGFEGVGRAGAAVEGVAAARGVSVADGGAQRGRLVLEGARPRFAGDQGNGVRFGRRVAIGAFGVFQHPRRDQVDLGHGVGGRGQRGRREALAVAQGEVRAPTGVELEVSRIAVGRSLLDDGDCAAGQAGAVEVIGEEPGGVVGIGRNRVAAAGASARWASGVLPPVAFGVDSRRDWRAEDDEAGRVRAAKGIAFDSRRRLVQVVADAHGDVGCAAEDDVVHVQMGQGRRGRCVAAIVAHLDRQVNARVSIVAQPVVAEGRVLDGDVGEVGVLQVDVDAGQEVARRAAVAGHGQTGERSVVQPLGVNTLGGVVAERHIGEGDVIERRGGVGGEDIDAILIAVEGGVLNGKPVQPRRRAHPEAAQAVAGQVGVDDLHVGHEIQVFDLNTVAVGAGLADGGHVVQSQVAATVRAIQSDAVIGRAGDAQVFDNQPIGGRRAGSSDAYTAARYRVDECVHRRVAAAARAVEGDLLADGHVFGVGSGRDDNGTAGCDLIDRRLNGLLGVSGAGAAVGVVTVDGVGVAGRRAGRVRLEVGRDDVRAKGHDDVIDVARERRAPAGADAGIDAIDVGRARAEVRGHAVAGLAGLNSGIPVVERDAEVLDCPLAATHVLGAADVAHPEEVGEQVFRLPGVGRHGVDAVVGLLPDQHANVVVGRVARRIVVVGEQQAQDGREVGGRGAGRGAIEVVRHARQVGQRPCWHGRRYPRLGEVGLVLAVGHGVGRELERAEAVARVVGGDADGGVRAYIGGAPAVGSGRGHSGVGRRGDLRQDQRQQQRRQDGEAAEGAKASTHDL